MRFLAAIFVIAVSARAFGETHIGFEAALDKEWNVVRLEKFYLAAHARTTSLVPGTNIVLVDKVRVQDPKTLHRYCAKKKPGQFVFLTVARNDELEEIPVVLVDGEEMRKSGFWQQ